MDAEQLLRGALNELGHHTPHPGQDAMAAAVGAALADRRHLFAQAGTGTGKTLAYLAAAASRAADGERVVIATYTKALQRQIVDQDLPAVLAAAKTHGVDLTGVQLKGRSNYACLSRAATALSDPSPGADPQTVAQLVAWAEQHDTGDRDDAPTPHRDADWATVSISGRDCPGADRCQFSSQCFAEAASARAYDADIVVVNAHLYAVHLAADGRVLPPHDAVVLDEAHLFEDIATDALGVELHAGRMRALITRLNAASPGTSETARVADDLAATGDQLDQALPSEETTRLDPAHSQLVDALDACHTAVTQARGLLHATTPPPDRRDHHEQALSAAANLLADLKAARAQRDDTVCWSEPRPGKSTSAALRIAPLDVGETLASALLTRTTTVAVSATLTVGDDLTPIASRLGVDTDTHPAEVDPATGTMPPSGGDAARDTTVNEEEEDTRPSPSRWAALLLDSPFDYPRQGLLYCPKLAPVDADEFRDQLHGELVALVGAAGGQALCLFTSLESMRAAARHLAACGYRVLTPDEHPPRHLVEQLRDPEPVVVCASKGYWQGVDVPGDTLPLVTIDRLPFPRRDDPVAAARSDRATQQRRNWFEAVYLPHAAVWLAQAAGRLIRSTTDRGVVAVFDSRLRTRRYAWTLVRSLPPFTRTGHRVDAEAWLAAPPAPPESPPVTPTGTRP